MDHLSIKFRTLLMIILTGLFIAFSISCKKKIDVIPKSDFLSYPSMTAKNFETELLDSGKTTLIMRAPLAEQYDNEKEPFTEFRFGLNIDFYNGKEYISGSVSSKYAKYLKNTNLWELKDSVIVINEKKDMLETELLFWDQAKDLIYTDRFVRITNVDKIVMGTGFESDSKLTRQRIRKVSATITFEDEE
jgi:LPS export ABC transporter protein LptC